MFLKLLSYRQGSIEKGKPDKLSPCFYGSYEVIVRVGPVAYMLRLPEGARVHPTFHVSLLKRCPNPSIAPVHPSGEMAGTDSMREPTSILDRRLVQRKGKIVTEVLNKWNGEDVEEAS